MHNHRSLTTSLEELRQNPEQWDAVHSQEHCIVLAGPGSGKTKTLTTAMARTLVHEVVDPRGVACITYNNECASELETRLSKLGIARGDRSFIGTVHGFALSEVIAPYARCVRTDFPTNVKIATKAQCRTAVEKAYRSTINEGADPQRAWQYASEKRKRDVDRNGPSWRTKNPELVDFIEAYEANLRLEGVIDFDDMPLLAYRLIRDNRWIREAIAAKYPVLFVDEYQDLGSALHQLVLLLCFGGGVRLFAVGDADQSIYGFTGANPDLLRELCSRRDVKTITLRFNYRSGKKIIRASLGALGVDRDYISVEGAADGEINFWTVKGGLDDQATAVASTVIPALEKKGIPLDQIAVLYRYAKSGDKLAKALKRTDTPFVRSDGNALVKRSSRLARFTEDCAAWVSGGWKNSDPPYTRLLKQATNLVYGWRCTEAEENWVSQILITFLIQSVGSEESTHTWLARFCKDLISPWRSVSRDPEQEWGICDEMMAGTDPVHGLDLPLSHFAGRIEGSGRVILSTLHSAKGREFDAVVMYGVNADDIPNYWDLKSPTALREARQLFYVGVTRPRKELSLIYQEGNHSPWVSELYQRSQ